VVAFALVVLVLAGPAGATPILIDLTDEDVWGPADGQANFSAVVGGVGVTLETDSTGLMTFNDHEGPGPISLANGGVLEGEGDGIGISNIGDRDEINADEFFTEALDVILDQPYEILEIFILDLFEDEIVAYSVGSGTGSFQAPADVPWGFKALDATSFDPSSQLRFWVFPPGPGDDGDNDYALAGLRVQAVQAPEPSATVLMLFAGVAALAARRRAR
jgi:hypothetical protein